MTTELNRLNEWLGKTETRSDQITLAPIAALSATLDRDDAPPQRGDFLPPLWHWLYFLPNQRHSGMGEDGHPKKGGFLPPVSLPRRMFAGAAYNSTIPCAWETLSRECRASPASITRKVRAGPWCSCSFGTS
jgi:3-methylfumaryl-CoA hydratase